jgi:protein-S-isoprenylcysteine O-methyltransferase Ste14
MLGSLMSMPTESIFYTSFWVLFGWMIVFQVYYAAWVRRIGGKRPPDSSALERERWLLIVIRIRSFLLITFLVLYILNPPWIGVFSLPFPGWSRWIGLVTGVLSLIFYGWSRGTLGKVWSSYLQLQKEHFLVTTGPYARVRHPIYLAIVCYLFSITLVAANWLLFAFLVVSVVVLSVRIPKEEQMMIERFGEEYKAYMRRTGRLFPK